MSKVLVIVGHPDLSQSKANAALVDAVRDLAHVTVHDLYATYPDFQIDVAAEQALLAEHEVIVFQHPVFWYNTTPLFKLWQDKVLTYGWAFTVDRAPSQLAGKKAETRDIGLSRRRAGGCNSRDLGLSDGAALDGILPTSLRTGSDRPWR
ncbi:NAD(P)H-dependent oxidoreductase [Actinoplanes subtropicus]|uniref:NAD(P)H-dependent oxidoreductase n=1 Tax=Actinoplanes subtropicus TaxID=543632 RepID=UPI0009FC3988|nr:NAD(P)H-dependent oxidoreductase [Actinoplanes subtropicus]